MKSFEFSSRNCFKEDNEVFLAKLSGSSPLGKVQTFTLIPCSRIKSIPLRAALIPAGSESNNTNEITVELSNDGCPIFIPQGLSPNGDGLNDIFDIQGVYDVFINHKLLWK